MSPLRWTYKSAAKLAGALTAQGWPVSAVEADKHVVPIGAKHAPRFLVGAGFFREEHHPELADKEVEALIVEAQILCVLPLERHAVGAEPLRRRLQHHRVHVGSYDLRLRYRPVQRPCQDAGAGGGLKNALRLKEDRAVGQNLRIGLEQRMIAGWNLL